MRRHRMLLVVATAALSCAPPLAVTGVAQAGVAATGGWHRPVKLPGAGAASTVSWVSCPSAGNCAAGGSYDLSGHEQGFVASERNGVWHRAIKIPGLAALNTSGYAGVTSVSCASAGNCVVGGFYTDRRFDRMQGFVANERGGIWHRAIGLAGTGSVIRRAFGVTSVSCGSPGNCAAIGNYASGSSGQEMQVFVANERNGTWHSPIEIPGTGTGASVSSVSCASAGNCVAVGRYTTGSENDLLEAFVASERNGTWLPAIEVPGIGALNTGNDAFLASVSCASAGNCSAGGLYTDTSLNEHAFVVSEVRGTWGNATKVAGPIGPGDVSTVSCASAGNCSAGGTYTSGRHSEAFVVSQVRGAWGKARELAASLNRGFFAGLASLSCGAVGNCLAGGYYQDRGTTHAFVASEFHGSWHQAIGIPGLRALSKGRGSGVESVSCASAGYCLVAGAYVDRFDLYQAFVASRT